MSEVKPTLAAFVPLKYSFDGATRTVEYAGDVKPSSGGGVGLRRDLCSGAVGQCKDQVYRLLRSDLNREGPTGTAGIGCVRALDGQREDGVGLALRQLCEHLDRETASGRDREGRIVRDRHAAFRGDLGGIADSSRYTTLSTVVDPWMLAAGCVDYGRDGIVQVIQRDQAAVQVEPIRRR